MLRSRSSLLTSTTTRAPQQTLKAYQARLLSIHEYQAQNLMNKNNIKTPKGAVATTAEEAFKAASSLGVPEYMVKAQVLAGGRGRGTFKNGFKGGVQKAENPEKAAAMAREMLGQTLVTKQTGEAGKPCNSVLIQELIHPKRELYFAILLDRAYNGPVMIGSTRGGMNIEEVAAETPELIYKIPIDIKEGITQEKAVQMAKNLGFEGAIQAEAADQITKLYNLFVKSDSTLIEINPLVETVDGQVICSDAKFNFDDNADFRQGEIFAQRDFSQEDPREVEAHNFNLNYIGLDGSIGCIVNGAGLAMATMDIIKLHGGSPANFLDVGGGASQDQVKEALKILNSDPKVRAILVNIFGGIMRCDLFALGVVKAATEIKLDTPLVVRLEGTNVDEGKKTLELSGLRIINADNLDEAAMKAVRVAEIMQMAKDINLKVNFEIPL